MIWIDWLTLGMLVASIVISLASIVISALAMRRAK